MYGHKAGACSFCFMVGYRNYEDRLLKLCQLRSSGQRSDFERILKALLERTEERALSPKLFPNFHDELRQRAEAKVHLFDGSVKAIRRAALVGELKA